MQVRCEHCSVKGNIPDSAIDKTVRCPRCGGQFMVTMQLVEQGVERRKAERVSVDGMDLDFGFHMGSAQIQDISSSGVGITPLDTDYDLVHGQEVQFDLIDKNTTIMKNLPAKVTRSGQSISGLEFSGLSKFQESELKLLLARKKFESEQQTATEEPNQELDASELKILPNNS